MRLRRLILHILPTLSEDEVSNIMAARLVVPNDFDDLLLCDNTEDMIDEKDLKSFEKERETMANTKSAQQALRLDWLSWQAAERKRRPAALQTAVPVYKGLDDHELLQDFPNTDMSKEEAQAFLSCSNSCVQGWQEFEVAGILPRSWIEVSVLLSVHPCWCIEESLAVGMVGAVAQRWFRYFSLACKERFRGAPLALQQQRGQWQCWPGPCCIEQWLVGVSCQCTPTQTINPSILARVIGVLVIACSRMPQQSVIL